MHRDAHRILDLSERCGEPIPWPEIADHSVCELETERSEAGARSDGQSPRPDLTPLASPAGILRGHHDRESIRSPTRCLFRRCCAVIPPKLALREDRRTPTTTAVRPG